MVKKEIAKKTTKKDQKKRSLIVVAPDENRFWVCNGLVLSDLRELSNALENMSDDNFTYHVNADKNDFCNWIKDTLKDKALALSLRNEKSRQGALKKVKERLSKLD